MLIKQVNLEKSKSKFKFIKVNFNETQDIIERDYEQAKSEIEKRADALKAKIDDLSKQIRKDLDYRKECVYKYVAKKTNNFLEFFFYLFYN